jgi:UDP-2-acetamido-3-amino-2,3-dideoxy-glucuronate N-acetyltransferase
MVKELKSETAHFCSRVKAGGESMVSKGVISPDAQISQGVVIWEFTQVREKAQIGPNTILGSYVYIDANVKIGSNCKIQNRALIYDPAVIQDGVFIGPGVILTNDKNPRSVSNLGELKTNEDWAKVGVEILEGASIGAGAICVAPVKVGKWALIGAGSVVTRNVKDFALVLGNPARQIGWVGPAGVPLRQISDSLFECPKSLTKFEVVNSELHEII